MGQTEEWVARENILRFRRKMAEARTPEERDRLSHLLDAEERKLTRREGERRRSPGDRPD